MPPRSSDVRCSAAMATWWEARCCKEPMILAVRRISISSTGTTFSIQALGLASLSSPRWVDDANFLGDEG